MTSPSSSPVALITGGSRGIGRAVAQRLAELGHALVITGRTAATLEAAAAELPGEALGVVADSTDPEAAKRVVATTLARFGRIDVLVNNAGVSGPGGDFLETPESDWWRVMEVNLRGPALYLRAVLPHMLERGSGTVVNIGSYGGIRPLPGNVPYGVSKTALARLTDSVAAEITGRGVDLFCVSPGLVRTDMTRDVPAFQDVPASQWSPIEAIGARIAELMQRDCARLHGRFLHVNDDLDVLLVNAERIEAETLYTLGLQGLDGRIG